MLVSAPIRQNGRALLPIAREFPWLSFAGTPPIFAVLKNKLIWVCICWAIAVGFGMHTLLAYKGKAGAAAPAPSVWPENKLVPRATGKPMVVMFAHPKCPCTRASIAEFESLVAKATGAFEPVVVFFRPACGAGDWSESSLVKATRRIPRVRIAFDDDGMAARLFGAETSGHTLVYSAEGKLLFSGGITGSRGHIGDNAGSAAVLALLTKPSRTAPPQTARVFGCELFGQCTTTQTISRN